MNGFGRLTKEEFQPGFDRVACELVCTDDQRKALLSTVHATLYEGMKTRLQSLSAAWPDGARWPSGKNFLQEQLRQELEDEDEWQEGDSMPEVPERDVFTLLLMRFSHVAHRLARNQQIRKAYAEDHFRQRHPFIIMNREPLEEHALCGRGSGVRLSVEDGLRFMEELTCNHPACRCTFDPART